MSAAPIAPVVGLPLEPLAQPALTQAAAPPISFTQLLTNGIDNVNEKVLNADKIVRAFTLDDSVPVHQVTYALDQASAAMELALQVRARLLDGYQQLMNMQL